jgi:hypothetical protein
MALDRWHIHPDTELDFEQGLIDPVAYLSRLLASTTDLATGRLVTTFDTYDLKDFQQDVHYLSIDDPGRLDDFRQHRTITVAVNPADLVAHRYQAKVVAATVSLHGIAAATPTFPLVVEHGPKSTDRLNDGSEITQFLQPRSTLVQVAAANNTAVGAAAYPVAQRPIDFWRRSVATDWTLSIEPDDVTQRKIDLSGLRKIDVALTYIAKRS